MSTDSTTLTVTTHETSDFWLRWTLRSWLGSLIGLVPTIMAYALGLTLVFGRSTSAEGWQLAGIGLAGLVGGVFLMGFVVGLLQRGLLPSNASRLWWVVGSTIGIPASAILAGIPGLFGLELPPLLIILVGCGLPGAVQWWAIRRMRHAPLWILFQMVFYVAYLVAEPCSFFGGWLIQGVASGLVMQWILNKSAPVSAAADRRMEV